MFGKETVQCYEADMLAFQLIFSGILVCKDEVFGDPKRCKIKVQLAMDSHSNYLADNATSWIKIPTLDEPDANVAVTISN